MAPEMSITVGVDTHADAHVGVVLDLLGRRQGKAVVPNTTRAATGACWGGLRALESQPASGSRVQEALEQDSHAS